MKAVENVERSGAFLANDLEIGFPHIRADEHDLRSQFVADDFEESEDDDDLEEVANRFENKRTTNFNDSTDSSEDEEEKKRRTKKPRRRPRVEIEYENEATQKVRVRN